MAKDARKRDTREKITLGGLVVKAGLRTAPPALLLGALLEISTLDPASERYRALLQAGRSVFATDADPLTSEPTNDHPLSEQRS